MLRREKNVLCTPNLNFRRRSKSPNVADDSNTDFHMINTSVFMHVPVIVVGRDDFDAYRDSIERLKDTGKRIFYFFNY